MNEYANILIRSVNRIGDVIFSLPSIGALKKAFPEAKLTVLAKPGVAELFQKNPSVDEILLFLDKGSHRGIRGRLRLAGELKRRKFDMAVVFHNCFDAALIPYLAGIPERIGYEKELRKFLLTRSMPFPKSKAHRIEQFLLLLSLVGVESSDIMPKLFISKTEENRADEFLERHGAKRPVIGIIPGSIARSRRWFPDRFAEVADRLVKHTGGSIIILGGPLDISIADEIKKDMAKIPIDMTGKMTLRQLMAIISRLDLVISNDTGPMHIAWTLGTPVITFMGVGDIGEIRPLREDVCILHKDIPCSPCNEEECPKGTIKCLDLITADEVYKAALEMLARKWNEKGF